MPGPLWLYNLLNKFMKNLTNELNLRVGNNGRIKEGFGIKKNKSKDGKEKEEKVK